ncbi:MAG: DUF3500 domain-containing protein [Bacteroidota bacterium]
MKDFFAILCLMGLLTACQRPPSAQNDETDSSTQTQSTLTPTLSTQALAFLQTLGPEERGKAQIEFSDSLRKDWHFFPKVRAGLPLREMNPAQQDAAQKLLKSCLSEQGSQKVAGIMQLERVLQELEERPVDNDWRNPALYYFLIAGDPAEPVWGWRLEGHHVSLNFTVVDNNLAFTPAFLGANPGEVREGKYKGTRVLHREEDLARELMNMLPADQQVSAMLTAEAPMEIITFVKQKVDPLQFEGLAVGQMGDQQKSKLLELLGTYLDNMQADIAALQWDLLREKGLDQLYFGWAGSLERGEAHYYRIHGPDMLIEYDNAQNEANHIHTVWRDLTDDFGEDLLRKHYQNASHHQH